jgi:hypothetical protein
MKNFLDQRMICTKFDWNWPNGSRDEDFLKKNIYSCYYLPLKKSEQIWIAFPPKDDLNVPSNCCWKFTMWFRRNQKWKKLQIDRQLAIRKAHMAASLFQSTTLGTAHKSGYTVQPMRIPYFPCSHGGKNRSRYRLCISGKPRSHQREDYQTPVPSRWYLLRIRSYNITKPNLIGSSKPWSINNVTM